MRPWPVPVTRHVSRELGPRGQGAQPEAAVVLVRRRDHAQRLARGPLRDRCVGERRPEQALDARDAFGRERERARAAVLADRTAGARRVADERPLRPTLGAARQVRQVARTARAASAGTRGRAGRAPAPSPAPPRVVERRRGTASAPRRRFGFRSCSVKSRSIASSPTSPTDSRYGSSRASRCGRTSDAPVTVPSSPLPWWSISSTWLSGSRRPPNRDFVRRIPFATAPTRPRSSVYRCAGRGRPRRTGSSAGRRPQSCSPAPPSTPV